MTALSSLQQIHHPTFTQHKISVQIKRDDQIDKVISGNKWRKLKYNILHAKAIGAKGIITFTPVHSPVSNSNYQQWALSVANKPIKIITL